MAEAWRGGTMSAEVLREAAAAIRSRQALILPSLHTAACGYDLIEHETPCRCPGPTVALAVADWLDTAGADIWAHGPLCECGTGCDACDDNLWEPHARAALAVARAYLGTAP